MYKEIMEKIKGGSSLLYGKRQLYNIYGFQRDVYQPGYHEACEYCAEELKKSGLEKVQILTHPADGETVYWGWTMPRFWEINEAELYLTSPVEKRVLLARYSDRPASLIAGSAPTSPKEGIEAELVRIPDGMEEEDYKNLNVKGKIVFTSQNARDVKKWAVKKGALGIITDVMRRFPPVREEGDLDDEVQWHFFHGEKNQENCFAFAITPKMGRYLRNLMKDAQKKGEKVKVFAKVDSRLSDGKGEMVTGIIPGTNLKNEEILIVGHLTEPGADDNASGCAIMLEIARNLSNLIKEGKLPRPKRSIRFLFMYEFYGTIAYLYQNQKSIPDIVAGFNIDNVGSSENLSGSSLCLRLCPQYLPSFVNDLMEKIFSDLRQEFSPSGFSEKIPLFRWSTGRMLGGDSGILNDPVVGVPTPMFITWPNKFYHSSADTPDKIDFKIMQRISIMVATYAYFIASAGYAESCWLAEEVMFKARTRIYDEMKKLFEKTSNVDNKDDLDSVCNETEERAKILLTIEEKTLLSVLRLVKGREKEKLNKYLEELRQEISEKTNKFQQETMRGIKRYAGSKGISAVSRSKKEFNKKEKEASCIYPSRTGCIPYTMMSLFFAYGEAKEELMRLKNKESDSYFNVGEEFIFWADGKRSLLEIFQLSKWYEGVNDIDSLRKHFEILERYGYIKLVKKTGKNI